MAVRVAINGFGRIGRLAFRQMFDAEGYEVVAINDLTSPDMLAHLLKYDTAQGKYKYAETVEYGEDSITVNGKKITIYAKANAAELPWGELDVDVVLECTGFYTSKAKAEAHINALHRRVAALHVQLVFQVDAAVVLTQLALHLHGIQRQTQIAVGSVISALKAAILDKDHGGAIIAHAGHGDTGFSLDLDIQHHILHHRRCIGQQRPVVENHR